MANQAAHIQFTRVGRAYLQTLTLLYAVLPIVSTPDMNAGYTSITYEIPKIDTFMRSAEGLAPFTPGQRPGQAKDIKGKSITITPKRAGTALPQGRAIANEAQRMAAAEQIVPGQMSQLADSLTSEIVAFFKNSDNATQKAPIRGSGALDVENTRQPLQDLQTLLLPYRGLQGNQFALEMFVDYRILTMLGLTVDFTGAGVGSAVAGAITPEEVATILKAKLSLDAVHVIKGKYNTAYNGEDAVLDDIANAVCGFALVDKVKKHKLDASGKAISGPDGGIAIAFSREPYIAHHRDDYTEYEEWHARCQRVLYSPRAGEVVATGYKWCMNVTGLLS